MNKIFTTLLFVALTVSSTLAQVNGSGYYRVTSRGLFKKDNKTDWYACVNHNQVYINSSSLTNQLIHSIQLVSGAYAANSDPAAVLYLSEPESKTSFNILAQGCNLRQMLSPQALVLNNLGNGDYVINATKSGTTLSLKNQTKLYDNHHYMCSTGRTSSQYCSEYWGIYPVNSDSEYDWFGIQPTLKAGDKHYASFFAGFPFKCKSDGMKVYVVSASNDEHFDLQEITGIIPASTPVLIECSSDDPKMNLIDILEPGSGKTVSGNKLKGVYFCNQYLAPPSFSGFITSFDANTMRVFNVKDDKLVLSTDKEGLFVGTYTDKEAIDYRGQLFIKANSGYLPVAASANQVLTLGKTTAINDVDASDSKIISITNIAGQKVNSLVPGVNLIKYSDGTVKKVIK